MTEEWQLKIRVRAKGVLGEVELEIPRVFVQYNSKEKSVDEVISHAINLYKGITSD